MKSILLIALMMTIGACSKGGKGGSKSAPPPAVSHVIFQSLDPSSVLPNDDLEISGTCQASAGNAPFIISVGGVEKNAICSNGTFSVTYAANELTPGPVAVNASQANSNENIPGTGPLNISKSTCNRNQDDNAGSCSDKPITSASASINPAAVTTLGGSDFASNPSLAFNLGSTANARFAYVFASAQDATDFTTNNCHLDETTTPCQAINFQKVNVIGQNQFNYSLPGVGSHSLNVLLANGTELSSVISRNIEFDNQAPAINAVLTSNRTRDPNAAPQITFTGGQISDVGNAGIKTLEYGLSSNGATPNLIPFTLFSNAAANLTVDLSGITVAESQNYQVVIRAIDNLDQVSTWVSGNFDYLSCPSSQDLTSGACIDKPVATPDFTFANTTTFGSDEVVSSNALVLSQSTTSMASKAFILNSSADCATFDSLNCHTNPALAGCTALTATEVTPSATMNHTVAGMAHNTAYSISVIYTNGSAKSSCTSKTVYLDNAGPVITSSLAAATTRNPQKTPVVNVSVADSGRSGVTSIDYAVSSDGTNDDILSYTSLSLSATNFQVDFGSSVLQAATNYKILIRSADGLGNTSTWSSGNFTYTACGLTQTLNGSDNCDDNAITTPEILISNATLVGSALFKTDSSLTIASGTTTDALKAHIFASASDCSNHLAGGCEANPAGAGCAAISKTTSSTLTSMAFTHPSLVSGVQNSVYAYYVNGTQLSSCVTKNITLDNQAPSFTTALDSTWAYSMLNGPKVIFNSGAVIADLGGSGIDKIQYGISTNGVSANVLAFQDISPALTEYTPDLSGALIGVGTDYFTIIKAIDKLGQETVVSTPAWRYTTCTQLQDTQPNGSCVDKDILTPAIAITNADNYSGNLYVISGNLTLSLGTTANAQNFYAFSNSTACSNFRTNNCHLDATTPSCTAITFSQYAASTSMSYSYPSVVDNTLTTVYGAYSNGSKISSCVSRSFKKNAPVMASLTSNKPIDIARVTTTPPTVTQSAITATDEFKPNAAASILTVSTPGMTTTAPAVTTQSGIVSRDSIFDGYTATFSGSLSDGEVLECNSLVIFSSPCSITATTFASSVHTDDVATLNGAAMALDLGTGFSTNLPYNVYRFSQMSDTYIGGDDVASSFQIFNGDLYFSSYIGPVETKLFKTNGTTLSQISNIAGPPNSDVIGNMVVFNSELYFEANDILSNRGVFKTDGSTYIKRVSPSAAWHTMSNRGDAVVYNSAIYHPGDYGSYAKYARFNGTNWTQLTNQIAGGGDIVNAIMSVAGGNLFFTMLTTGNREKLFKTNGTTIDQAVQINIATTGDKIYTKVIEFNGNLYFGGLKLMRINGTQSVALTNTNTTHSRRDDIANLVVFNGHLYFSARDSSGNRKIYKMAPNETITQVSNMNAGLPDASGAGYDPVACNGELYWPALDSNGDSKVFKVETNRLVELVRLNEELGSTDTTDAAWLHTCYNNELYFTAKKAGYFKLWKMSKQVIQ